MICLKNTGRFDRWSLNWFLQDSSSKRYACSKIKQLVWINRCDWCQSTLSLSHVSRYAHRLMFFTKKKLTISRQDKTECVPFKIWSCHISRPECKIESYFTTETQKKKLIASVLIFIATIVRLFLKFRKGYNREKKLLHGRNKGVFLMGSIKKTT